MARAACLRADPELFFPITRRDEVDSEVKAICAKCPVRRQCFDYALADSELVGTWAGTSVTDRRRLRMARRKSA